MGTMFVAAKYVIESCMHQAATGQESLFVCFLSALG